MAMYTYMTATTADYTGETFSLSPNAMRQIGGPENQQIKEFDDGSKLVIDLGSDDSRYNLELDYSKLTPSQADTLESIFHDSLKAKKYARTWQLLHPIDTYTYVVQFLSRQVRESNHANTRVSMGKAMLYVKGFVTP